MVTRVTWGGGGVSTPNWVDRKSFGNLHRTPSRTGILPVGNNPSIGSGHMILSFSPRDPLHLYSSPMHSTLHMWYKKTTVISHIRNAAPHA